MESSFFEMDLPKLLDIGKELNLQGQDLIAFISQREEAERKSKIEQANVAREERLAEREAKKEEAEREAKREALRHEREMLTLRIEADRASAVAEESRHNVMESTRDVRPFIRAPPLPRFHESEGNIDVYIERFERYAANEGWEYGCYAIYLSALLDGPALDIYHRMPLEDANDYKALKEALLKRYSFTAQDFRKRFFNSKQAQSESATQFLSRLKHYLLQWIELSKIEHSFEDVMDVLLREQFRCSCPRDLSLFLRERSVKNVSSISEWAEVYADSRDCVGIKPVKDSSNSQQNGEQKGSRSQPKPGNTPFSRPPPTCFLCNQVGHKVAQCRAGQHRHGSSQSYGTKHTGSSAIKLKVTEDPHVCSNQAVLDCGCKLNVQAGCGAMAFRKLHVMKGTVNGQVVEAIRDTGCTTVMVRQNLVYPSQCTGEECLFVMVDNTTKSFPLVRCQVDTPIFSGELIAVCIPNPISDIIIGNIPGVHQEDLHWKPGKTRIGVIHDSPIFKNRVTTEREALERQLKKLQLDCAGHEKREYEATRKVRDSIQMVENAVLEKDKAIREKRSVEAELVMFYQEGIVLVGKDMSSKDDLVKRACYAKRSRDEAIAKHNSIRNEIDRIKNSTREQKEKLDMELNTLHNRIDHITREVEICAEERIKLLQQIDELKRNEIVLKQERNNSEKKLMKQVAVRQTEMMQKS